MRLEISKKQFFRRALLRWYRLRGRDLPWRHTADPYEILVSEIMLQQTQVDRVKVKYGEFLRRFPTLYALARSKPSQVIRAWQGMGYNRRALNLQRACHDVVERFGGSFPSSIEELKSLSGIGEYTARAMSVFAFRRPVIALDVNIRRVLDRFFFGIPRALSPRAGDSQGEVRQLIILGDSIVTPKTAYDLNQGLMDLGALICTAQSPQCAVCPLKKQCKAYPAIVSLSWSSLKKIVRSEPSYASIPRRLWRGKVVEMLRNRSKPVSFDDIAIWLTDHFHTPSRAWLREVTTALVGDQLIQRIEKRKHEYYQLQ